jgi:hypothetical protein
MKKSKQDEDADFDDMLAEFWATDLTTARSQASFPATSSSSFIAGTDSRPSITSLPDPAAANATGRNVSEATIISACIEGNLTQLRRWGQQGVWVGTAEPLGLAVFEGIPLEVLSCLVKELGADVNQRDKRGCTSLAMASYKGYPDIVRFLAEELRADVNIRKNEDGRTPLCMGAEVGSFYVVRTLLRLGADINSVDAHGTTPLMIATAKKHQEIVKWLVKAGADTQTIWNNDQSVTAAGSNIKTFRRVYRADRVPGDQDALLEPRL